MATPHVAGAVLQLLQHHPDYKPADVMRALDCMSTKGAVTGAIDGTPDRLLHTGAFLHSNSSVRVLQQIDDENLNPGLNMDADAQVSMLSQPECHPESHPDLDDQISEQYLGPPAATAAPAAGALQP